jgi:ABC-2 type transport system permease protein
MRATVAIVSATARQLMSTRRAIIFAFAEAAVAGVYLLMAGAFSDEAIALERLYFLIITLYFPLLVPIVTLILASAALGAERRDGTLSFLVLRPIPRSAIATAKVVATVIVAGALNAFGALALSVAFAVESGTWDLVIPLVVGGLVATIVYAAVFLPLGFFTDRAVAIGLVFVLVFENGVAFAAPGLASLSPWRLGFSVFAGLTTEELVDPEIQDFLNTLASMSAAFLRTAAVAIVSIAFVTLVLRRRDLAAE